MSWEIINKKEKKLPPTPLTKEVIIERFKEKHGDKYDYSLVLVGVASSFVNRSIVIICKEHGQFKQTINTHFISGCLLCCRDNWVRPSQPEKKPVIKVDKGPRRKGLFLVRSSDRIPKVRRPEEDK